MRRWLSLLPWAFCTLFLIAAFCAPSTHTTCTGLVIEPPADSWVTVRIWTDAPVVESGPGINREAWEYLAPQPYQVPAGSTLTITGACVVWVWQDGIGSSRVVYGGLADFNCDGDTGTDQDIESFFACLAGDCCPACSQDFDGDGDPGTDADIEAFFRVLGGGAC